MKKEITNWEQALLDKESRGYGTVTLLVDGINVSYQFGRGNSNKLYFIFHIDGEWIGEYSKVDNDYGKRFGCPVNRRMSQKTIKEYSRFYSKKQMQQKIADYNRCIGYKPHHSSSKSVINTLKKNNQSIELKKEEEDAV